MLDRLAHMRIPLHSSSREEPDAALIRLGKGVGGAAAHGLNGSTHRFVSPSQGSVANWVGSLRKNEAARAYCFLSLSQSLVVILADPCILPRKVISYRYHLDITFLGRAP